MICGCLKVEMSFYFEKLFWEERLNWVCFFCFEVEGGEKKGRERQGEEKGFNN